MGRKIIKHSGLIPIVSGFTLIEVSIIVVIIAALGTLVMNALVGQINKGNDAKRKGDLDRIRVAIEEYEKDHNCYPLVNLLQSPANDLLPYLDKLPRDPKTGNYYGYEVPSGNCPYYFRLSATLENSKDQNYPTYKVSSPNAP